MNQEKVGKLIATLRKSKEMTQDELGEKLGISGKSVSKWERGLNAPDISLLKELSSILGISVVELLDGQITDEQSKNKNIESNKKEIENTLIKSIDMYQQNTKKVFIKTIVVIVVTFLVLIVSLSFLYGMTNYNKIKMYTITNSSEELKIEGNIIFNPTKKYIIISQLKYNDIYEGTNKEKKAQAVKITLITNEKTVLEYGNLDKENYEIKSLSDYLEPIKININERMTDEDGIIKEQDLNDLYLTIEYIDINNNHQTLRYKVLLTKEFENNKILY